MRKLWEDWAVAMVMLALIAVKVVLILAELACVLIIAAAVGGMVWMLLYVLLSLSGIWP